MNTKEFISDERRVTNDELLDELVFIYRGFRSKFDLDQTEETAELIREELRARFAYLTQKSEELDRTPYHY